MRNIALYLLVLLLLFGIFSVKALAKADKEFQNSISEVYIASMHKPKEEEKEKTKIEDSILYIKPFEINYTTITWEENEAKKQKAVAAKRTAIRQVPNNCAEIIWNTFKSWGWSNAVSAGVLGNIMSEVGGHTLKINPYLYGEGGNYYGLCQWSIYYFPGVKGASLEGQLQYLKNTIVVQMSGYGYSNFLSIGDAAEAAKVFARYYERCANWSYSNRMRCAQIAYASFVS